MTRTNFTKCAEEPNSRKRRSLSLQDFHRGEYEFVFHSKSILAPNCACPANGIGAPGLRPPIHACTYQNMDSVAAMFGAGDRVANTLRVTS